jgi:hypothetical protein
MTCPSCQTANPDGAKFCMSCGAALSNACPECSTELPEGARFCYQCGHQMGEAESAPVQALLQQYIPKELLTKLEAARAGGGMQGERRIVTMLFCDVAGSTVRSPTTWCCSSANAASPRCSWAECRPTYASRPTSESSSSRASK